MTISVAMSLLDHNQLIPADLARRFAEDYHAQPRRGYGGNVQGILRELRDSDYRDVLAPAKHQFKGSGSLGNGAAMRASPVGLFSYGQSNNDLIDLAFYQSLITHTNPHGYNGAILQALAVNQALNLRQTEDLDTNAFLNDLIHEMEAVESGSPRVKTQHNQESRRMVKKLGLTPYTDKLKEMRHILNDNRDMTSEHVVLTFGNSVLAPLSVTTAIYAALRANKPIVTFATDNRFLRTLFLSISFGGDTDTIASMACGIAGALYGDEEISPILIRRCEGNKDMTRIADRLFECATKRSRKLVTGMN